MLYISKTNIIKTNKETCQDFWKVSPKPRMIIDFFYKTNTKLKIRMDLGSKALEKT